VDDLVAFLRQCLAEDERIARELGELDYADEGGLGSIGGWPLMDYLKRFGSTRVLAEVEAKRLILDQIEPWLHVEDEYDGVETTLRAEGTELLCHLAQPYAGWPGWREEWRA
jgi:hypothetical protein